MPPELMGNNKAVFTGRPSLIKAGLRRHTLMACPCDLASAGGVLPLLTATHDDGFKNAQLWALQVQMTGAMAAVNCRSSQNVPSSGKPLYPTTT